MNQAMIDLKKFLSDWHGGHQKCLLIGEVAQAHDGSLGTAHAFVDAIAEAGADAVKFQTHIADAESTFAEPWRVKFSRQDATRFDYWKRMEFTEEQWLGLKTHAEERGLIFLSSPFSSEAVELLEHIGVTGWKVASGEIKSGRLLEQIARTRKPVLLSSGMSSWNDLDRAVATLRRHDCVFGVMQCTTAYPCPPETIGLNVLGEISRRYSCPAGLSDHSGTVFPGFAAATLGAAAIEVHVTLSRQMFGPDVPASVTVPELRLLADGLNFIQRMQSNPVDKDALSASVAPKMRMFEKSIVAKVALPAGHVISDKDLALKKPGFGLPEERFDDLLGRKLKKSLAQNALINEADLE